MNLATIESDGTTTTTQYTHSDHLSSTSVVTDSTGTIIELVDYYPFGDIRFDNTSTGFSEDKKYAGHHYDEETGLSYQGARYYNPASRRFASLDPASLNQPHRFLTDPQQLNFYTYVRNNPMVYVDPTGTKATISSFLSSIFEIGMREPAALQSANMILQTTIDINTAAITTVCDPCDLALAGYGRNLGNGDEISGTDRGLSALGSGLPFVSGAMLRAINTTQEAAGPGIRQIDNVVNITRQEIRDQYFWAKPRTLRRHFRKHGADFDATDKFDYATQANNFFIEGPLDGADFFTGSDGNIRIYDQASNTFGSYNSDGTTRTFFKPNVSGEDYWANQKSKWSNGNFADIE